MSRGLTTWNDETITLIKENFIAVSLPTWVCRAKCPEGEFLRGAAIDKRWVTSSGYMNCVSSSGELLGGRPSQKVLDEFNKLPESERKPGAIRVPDLPPNELAIPSPPVGGLVLRVHARFLSRGDDGQLRYAKTTDFPLMRDKPNVMQLWQLFLQPNTEYMWLTRDEWKGMVPADPTKGKLLTVAPAIGERMARFHLTPQRAMTSEGGIVSKRSVKAARLSLVVEDVSPRQIQMRLEGFVHWGSDYDESKATTPNGALGQGFETPLYGRLEYDRMKQTFTRFDIVAPGQVWGRWGDANGKSMYVERPGKNPFGFAFELATGNSPSDRLPPGGNGRYVSERTGYFSTTRAPVKSLQRFLADETAESMRGERYVLAIDRPFICTSCAATPTTVASLATLVTTVLPAPTFARRNDYSARSHPDVKTAGWSASRYRRRAFLEQDEPANHASYGVRRP